MKTRSIPLRLALAWLLLGSAAAVRGQDENISTRDRLNDVPPVPRFPPSRVMIFFPPYPPALDQPVPRPSPTFSRRSADAPAGLAPFVNEIFYPQLATRLFQHELTPAQKTALDAYRAEKLALQNELRATLDRTRDLDPAARLAALEALARVQTPKIAALEKKADAFRRELLVKGASWGAEREWRLGDHEPRGFSPLEIASVVRAAAFFENGLLPAQRRLLLEISLELLMAGDTTERATANLPQVFFQPELARVAFPDNLPADLAAKLAAFQTAKARLKKELYDTIYSNDGGSWNFLRRPYEALAGKQAQALAELEKRAEEIRRGLAVLPNATPPAPRSPLPVALTTRLVTLLRDTRAMQEDTIKRTRAILAHAADLAIRYSFDDDGLRFVVASRRALRTGQISPGEQKRIDEVRAEFSAVADAYGRRLAELINERDAIRRDAAEALGTKDRKAIDAALTAANRIAMREQNQDANHDYRAAVFEPGLSPEQRRLLFDAALEHLNIPLPTGNRQPIKRGPSW